MLNEGLNVKVDPRSLELANYIFGDPDQNEANAPALVKPAIAISTEGKSFGYADETGFFWGDSDTYRHSPGFIPGYWDGTTFTPSGGALTIDNIEVDRSDLIKPDPTPEQQDQSVVGAESFKLAGSIFGEEFAYEPTPNLDPLEDSPSDTSSQINEASSLPEASLNPQRQILIMKKKVENSGE